jgi:hypothetical protein
VDEVFGKDTRGQPEQRAVSAFRLSVRRPSSASGPARRRDVAGLRVSDAVDFEDVDCQDACGLGAQERAPGGGIGAAPSARDAVGAQDPADGGR